jgi:hypothetical protein
VGLPFLERFVGVPDILAIDPLDFEWLKVILYLLGLQDFFKFATFLHARHQIEE